MRRCIYSVSANNGSCGRFVIVYTKVKPSWVVEAIVL